MDSANAKRRPERYTPLWFWAGLALLMGAMIFLMMRQSVQPLHPDIYMSDIPLHINFIVSGDTAQYSLYHLIMSLFYPFVGADGLRWVTIVMMAGCNIASILITRRFLRERAEGTGTRRLTIDGLTLALFTLSMIITNLPGFYPYLSQWTPNPWHNPTYIICRPFAILSFIYMVRFKEAFDARRPYAKYYLPLGVWTFLSVAFKPSFFLVFIVACALYMLVDLIVKKFKPLKAYLLLALSLVPGAAIILIQNQLLYHTAENANQMNLVFSFGEVWKLYTPSIPVSILLGLAFPIYVTVWLLCTRRFKQGGFMLFISLLTYAVAFAEFYSFAESNHRFVDANFAWGYCYSMFFLFLVGIVEFFIKDKSKNAAKWIGLAIFLAHLGSGLFYFGRLLTGADYY